VTGLRGRKIVRDLRATWVRVLLMTVAVAVSVVTVGAFLSAREILSREIRANYRATQPASATLHVPGGIDPTTLATARSWPGVLDAAARSSVPARVRTGTGPWRALLLFASGPSDPRSLATPLPQVGTWPPPADALMLERTALDFLGVRTGDRITVEVPGGRPAVLTVTGTVHDGGMAPASQEQTAYAYATTRTLVTLGAPTTLDELRILVGRPSAPHAGVAPAPTGDQARIDATAQALAHELTSTGHPVDHVEIPPPLRHPHQGQMVMVGFLLLAFGLTALLLSSVLVATLLGGLITGQIRQIGSLKAIGARTGQILTMYLWLTAAIGVLATAVALPAGLLGGRFLARTAARMLNLDLTDTSVPAWVYLTVVAAGIGMPLLVALVPLVRGSRITVRQALDSSGTDPAGASGRRLDRMLSRTRGLGRAELLGLRNTFRRRGRLALSVGLLGVAGTMFLTGLDAAGGWTALVDQGMAHRHYDLDIALARPEATARLTALVRSVPGVQDVEGWGRAPASVHVNGRVDTAHTYPDEAHDSFTAYGLPAETPLLRLPLRQGRWLRADDTDAVVLNHLVPALVAPGIGVGDPITLTVGGRVHTWHVVGIASDFGTQGAAYLTDQEFAAATASPGRCRLLRIVTTTHDEAAREQTLARVDDALTGAGVGIAQGYAVSTLRTALDQHVLVLADALIALAAVVGFVALLGLASTLTTNVLERTREFAVLATLGATPAAVRTIVVTEGLVTSVLSVVPAALVALPLTRVLGDFICTQAFRTALPFRFSVPALVVWTVLVLLGAAGAGLAAAARASRLTVREALTAL